MQECNKTFDSDLTGEEYIELIFQKTGDDGIVYIPGWYGLDTPEHSKRCVIYWDYDEFERLKAEFSAIKASLTAIAKLYDSIDASEQNARRLLSATDFEVWKTYISDFNTGNTDMAYISDIQDRMETVESIQKYAERLSTGKELDNYEKEFLKEYFDTTVTEQERADFQQYINRIFEDCEQRIGSNICAYETVIRAKRFTRLVSWNAPDIIVRNEERTFAAAFAMHKYGKSIDNVSESVRLQWQSVEEMTDEQLDELARPKKQNSRKSMLPLFVYLVLKEYSSAEKPMRQPEILEKLANDPYEIIVERKALSRALHGLLDSNVNIYGSSSGVWYEASEVDI